MYVVGYPKSGNTWLCFLLAYCLNAEYDDIDAPGIHPTKAEQRRYVKGGLAHTSYQNQVGKILKTHQLKQKFSTEPLVYLVRDGRDVMVSYYFFKNNYLYARNSSSVKKYLLQIRNLINSNFQTTAEYQDFSNFLRQYSDEWVNHTSLYLQHPPTAVIRYEDLKTAPEATLNKLFEKLEVQVTSDIIQQALAIFDFQRLSQRQEGEEDPSSFFRKGIVGDWQNHFSPEDLQFFQQRAAKIMTQLGYD